MIWVILIVAYLLLVAMALGFSLGLDEDAEYEMYIHCIVAFTTGWVLIPFAIVAEIGALFAYKYKEQ